MKLKNIYNLQSWADLFFNLLICNMSIITTTVILLLVKMNEVKGTTFKLLETLKFRNNTWKNSLQVTGHQAEKDSNSWGIRNTWGELYHCPSLLSWESFQATWREGKPSQIPANSLNLRDKADSPGRPRQFECSGQSNRKEKGRESCKERGLQEFVENPFRAFNWVLMLCACVWGNYPKLRKASPERVRGNSV